MSETETRRRVEQLLAEFGLAAQAGDNPFRLSQGQKRRLSLATMLAAGQQILVLDEPTFGQDRRSARQIMEHLRRLNQGGVTIVMITHDMRLVAEYARHVAVLANGRVVYQGETRSLYRQAALLEETSLVIPPLYRLAQRMQQEQPAWPDLMTCDDWVTAYT